MDIRRRYFEKITFLVLFAVVLASGNAFAQDPSQEYRTKGREACNRGDYDEAIADETKAIELNPKQVANYCNRAISYYMKGAYDKALLDYNKAIEVAPNSGFLYESRAKFYYWQKDYDKAWVDERKAQDLNNGNTFDTFFLAKLKKASGREN